MSRTSRRIWIAVAALVVLAGALCAVLIPRTIRANRYRQAVTYAEHGLYDEAVPLFSRLSGHEDSDAFLDYCLLRKAAVAGDYAAVGQYAARIPEFRDASEYRALSDCCAMADAGDPEGAIEGAREIGLGEAAALLASWQRDYAQAQGASVRQAMALGDWDRARSDAERALRYCDDPALAELRDECVSEIRSRDYGKAVEALQDGDYDGAQALLGTLDGYGDSAALLGHLAQGAQGRAYIDALFSGETDPHALASLYAAAGDYADAAERAQAWQAEADAADYALAQERMSRGEWREAGEIFSALGAYEDSPVLKLVCDDGLMREDYADAAQLMELGEYEAAEEAFLALGDYADSELCAAQCRNAVRGLRYERALQLLDAGWPDEAYAIFAELGDYRDSAMRRRWLEMEGVTP